MKCHAVIRISMMLMAALALPACQQSEQSAPASQDSAQASPEAKPGLSVSAGVLVLPVVSGRPGAAYFTLNNNGKKTAELAAVHIDGAIGTEMHETKGGTMSGLDTLPIESGGTIAFAQGGKHVMAFDLSEDLEPGASTEMTLSFADGDKLSAPLAIKAMGAIEDVDHGEAN
jgi:periplasmic copper chaperone A